MGYFGAIINGFKGDKSARLASHTNGLERIKLNIEAIANYQTKEPYDNSGYKVINKMQDCWNDIMATYNSAKNNYNQNKDFNSLVTVYDMYDYLSQYDKNGINYLDCQNKIKNHALEEVVESIRNKYALSGKKKLNEKHFEEAYEDFVKCQKLHLEISPKDISTCLADINYEKGMNFFRNEQYYDAVKSLNEALKNGAKCINELNKAKAEAYFVDAKSRGNTSQDTFQYYVRAHEFGKSCDDEIAESGRKYVEYLKQMEENIPIDGTDSGVKISEAYIKIRDVYQIMHDNTKYDFSKQIADSHEAAVKFLAITYGWTDGETKKVEDDGKDDYNYAVNSYNRGDYKAAKQYIPHATFLSQTEIDDFIEACDAHLQE